MLQDPILSSRKAQVLMVSLWILAILTMLAVGIGHRVAMALRLSRYQRDKFKGLYLAKAGLNLAIAQLQKDANDYDALGESWADNEEVFKKIILDDEQTEFATVSYVTTDEYSNPRTIYGMTDEERKININTAPKELLVKLLEKKGISNSSDIANNICAWRGDTGPNIIMPDYQDLGYTNKGKAFVNIEELILVKDIDQQTYSKLKDSISVYGEGKVNINTVYREILEILIEYCRIKIPDIENDPGDLVDRIIQARPANSFSNLQVKLTAQGELNSGQINILNELQTVVDFKSSCFYIQSSGKINSDKRISSINCVFNRSNKNILYWHES